jgi:L-seryl-tRNA(Ser) seleniumtransferase
MLLLEDYGVITVHFAGMPPGTSSLLLKFVPPETLERFGGAEALAKAVDSAVDRLAALLREPAAFRTLLVGEG